MPISDFEDMMPDTVTHSEYISSTSYGVESFGSPATVTCRLTYEPKTVLNQKGEEVVAKATMWLSSTTTTIDPKDKFVTSFGDRLYVLNISRIQDEDDVHHIKVFFG